MEYKLSKFTTMWDEAALETLGSEFEMMSLLSAQDITEPDGSSILDCLVFEGGMSVSVPEKAVAESTYFRAPWEV